MKTMIILLIFFLQSGIRAQVPGWKGKIEEKNNVQYVHNPKQGLWDKDKSKKLTLTRVFSLGSLNANEEYLFNWVKDITTDKAGNIYVQDDLNYRVSIFKNNGKFYKSFFYKNTAIAGEEIEIDPSGNVLINHHTFFHPTTNKTRLHPIVTAYSLKGKVVNGYGEPQLLIKKDGYGRPRYCSNGFVNSTDDKLIVYFSNPYLIHFYQQGRLIKVIDRDNPIFTKAELLETNFTDFEGRVSKVKSVAYRSNIRFLHVLPGNKFLVCICDRGKNYKQNTSDREFDMILDLYDSDGFFLKSFPWDWRKNGLLIHVDSEGNFYSNYGETEIVPGVTKWTVFFE